MKNEEQMQDWLFHYRYVYRTRRTKKGKQRFLSALVADITAMRQDVTVIAYNQPNYHSRNVYVGDIEKADKIICTYYDTPPAYLGSYALFNRKEQRSKTLWALFLGTVITLGIGSVGVFFYMKFFSTSFAFHSFQTWGFIALFSLYFMFLGKVTKGLSSRQTFIRNTSSVLVLLAMMRVSKDASIAYAFIDEGSFGEAGLDVIKASGKKDSQLFFLDSVGGDAPLHFQGHYFSKTAKSQETIHLPQDQQTNYIFGGRELAQTGMYYLSQADLKQKTLNVTNLEKIIAIFDSKKID